MPYIQRDASNKITALYAAPCYQGQEFLVQTAPEVLAFLELEPSPYIAEQKNEGIKDVLSSSDLASVRIIDDLVFLLIEKGVIRLTDLPRAAQQKLLARQHARASLNDLPDLLEEEDPLV